MGSIIAASPRSWHPTHLHPTAAPLLAPITRRCIVESTRRALPHLHQAPTRCTTGLEPGRQSTDIRCSPHGWMGGLQNSHCHRHKQAPACAPIFACFPTRLSTRGRGEREAAERPALQAPAAGVALATGAVQRNKRQSPSWARGWREAAGGRATQFAVHEHCGELARVCLSCLHHGRSAAWSSVERALVPISYV